MRGRIPLSRTMGMLDPHQVRDLVRQRPNLAKNLWIARSASKYGRQTKYSSDGAWVNA